MSRLVFHNNKMVFITYDITQIRPFVELSPSDLIYKMATGDSVERHKAETEVILRSKRYNGMCMEWFFTHLKH